MYYLIKVSGALIYKLAPETTVYAGHNTPTTIGDEKENNPYVR